MGEDAHITNTKDLGNGRSLFAVFDGHGGKEAAKYPVFITLRS